ncbi:helix-turn-helix domain-containing protein [Micromonospora sp. NPDC050276]|uniref:helix-turn-helix domain-containing protein n=1 Tax=Micromonospora sp. NPDC050276 TaxID=3364278 RepID=UPI003798204D
MPSVPPQEIAKAWIALGQLLASSRKAASYTQEAFAPLVNYGRSTIANVETGRQRVGRNFCQRRSKPDHRGPAETGPPRLVDL